MVIALALVVIVGVGIGVTVNRSSQRLQVARHFALKSDARRILRYYAGLMRDRTAYVENLKLAHNPALHRYVVLKIAPSGPPPSCPRVENCANPPPSQCWLATEYDPPACVAPPPRQPLRAYDAQGNELIPVGGLTLGPDFLPTTGPSPWRLRAYWVKQSDYQAHYELELAVTPGSKTKPLFAKARMTFPVKQCFDHRSERYRTPWNDFFTDWYGTWIQCPNNYDVISGTMMLSWQTAETVSQVPATRWKADGSDVGYGVYSGRTPVPSGMTVTGFVTRTAEAPPSTDVDFTVLSCCWSDDQFEFD